MYQINLTLPRIRLVSNIRVYVYVYIYFCFDILNFFFLCAKICGTLWNPCNGADFIREETIHVDLNNSAN